MSIIQIKILIAPLNVTRSQTDLAGNPRYFAYNCLTPKFLNSDLVSLSFGYLSLVWNNGVNLQL